jgi:NADH-quinone oxidoreductase chain G
MISIRVNNLTVQINAGTSILEACKTIGVTIPRFCYHETLSIAGNCRMCLVEIEGMDKPVASCLTEVSENLIVYTDSVFVKKARENVVEALLLNHPLDCPICDQAGECDLQDQTKSFGSNYSKFFSNKRGVEDKNCGPLIKTIMTRCIHCTRCVRFGAEVAGIDYLGTFNRGTSTEIGSYVSNFFDSEISGNVIDLCPVGALTSKPFAYRARPWELRVSETIDTTDSTGANIYVNFKGTEIFRVLPKNNKNVNDQLISDKARFSYDSSDNNRLRHIFEFKKHLNKYRSINWTKFFKQLDNDKIANEANFIINEDIGFNNINLLNQIERSQKKIKLSTLRTNKENTNLYLWGLNDKINTIDTSDSLGLIFSLNPKVECSVINARIRTRMQNSLLSMVSLNQYFSANIKVQFMNLNLVKSLRIFEGKYIKNSKNFIAAESPLILISDFFNKRNLTLLSLTCYLKKSFETVKILKINESVNTESLQYFNIKNFFKKNIDKISNTLCVNLDDTYSIRKNLFNNKNDLYWFNSHSSKLEKQTKIVVPILSEFEDERIFLNLEQRPQKTNKTFSSYFDARSLNSILISAFENFKMKNKINNHWNFLNEIVENYWLFDEINKIYGTLNYKTINFLKNIEQLSKYPTKSNLEDFYCSNKATRNSINMLQCSQQIRTIRTNFL